MTKYIFVVLLFISCAMPAGAQPGSHEESDKQSSVEPQKSLEEFRQGPRPYTEGPSARDQEYFLKNQALYKRMEEIKKLIREADRLLSIDLSDPANIPEIYIRMYKEKINSIKKTIKEVYGDECDAYSACEQLIEKKNRLEKRIEELEVSILK